MILEVKPWTSPRSQRCEHIYNPLIQRLARSGGCACRSSRAGASVSVAAVQASTACDSRSRSNALKPPATGTNSARERRPVAGSSVDGRYYFSIHTPTPTEEQCTRTLFLSPKSASPARSPMQDATDVDEGSFVLVAAFRRQRDIALAPTPEPWRWWEVAERAEQLAHGPAYRPSEWFGLMTPDRILKRCRRAIARLESAGLIVTWRKYGGRLSHLKVTPAGERLAQALIAKHEPQAEVAPSLVAPEADSTEASKPSALESNAVTSNDEVHSQRSHDGPHSPGR
jgi:hypothetical protein